MDNLLGNLFIEIAFLSLLGFLYYLYQRRKILHYEENKGPMVMGYILHSCITERGDSPHKELDVIIESIDDYLHNRISSPPVILLKHYSESPECSPELKAVIVEGLSELD